MADFENFKINWTILDWLQSFTKLFAYHCLHKIAAAKKKELDNQMRRFMIDFRSPVKSLITCAKQDYPSSTKCNS